MDNNLFKTSRDLFERLGYKEYSSGNKMICYLKALPRADYYIFAYRKGKRVYTDALIMKPNGTRSVPLTPMEEKAILLKIKEAGWLKNPVRIKKSKLINNADDKLRSIGYEKVSECSWKVSYENIEKGAYTHCVDIIYSKLFHRQGDYYISSYNKDKSNTINLSSKESKYFLQKIREKKITRRLYERHRDNQRFC